MPELFRFGGTGRLPGSRQARLLPAGALGPGPGHAAADAEPQEVKALYEELFSLNVNGLEIVSGDPMAAQMYVTAQMMKTWGISPPAVARPGWPDSPSWRMARSPPAAVCTCLWAKWEKIRCGRFGLLPRSWRNSGTKPIPREMRQLQEMVRLSGMPGHCLCVCAIPGEPRFSGPDPQCFIETD